MTTDRTRFVKSASTSTPVSNSRGELEKLVTRYGCSSFATQVDYEAHRATVTFVVPDTPDKGARKIPVQLEVNILAVYDALYGQPQKWGGSGTGKIYDPKGYKERELAQAERVAWRQLILWVDAALSAASAGVQSISEAFFAHTLIRRSTGEMVRVIDHVNELAPGGDWKALLPPPRDS